MPITLAFYIARQFLLKAGIIFVVVSFILLLSSFLEMLRLSYGKSVPINILLQLMLLKYPYLVQRIAPFLILLGSIFTYSRLTKNNELIVTRSAGISAWQFLAPVVLVAFLLGCFMTGVLHPLSSVFLNRQEKLANKYLRTVSTTIAISPQGPWLRENNDVANSIMHAKYIYQKDMTFYDVTFLLLTAENRFADRIDAKVVTLEPGYWNLKEVIEHRPGQFAIYKQQMKLPTALILTKLQDSFASPETISFWELPEFIKTLNSSGFSALRHSLYFYSLLMQPIFFCSMVLIGAAFSLRSPRTGMALRLMIIGGIVGFSIYFFGDLISALGAAGILPTLISALVPVTVSMLIGIMLILHLEDG